MEKTMTALLECAGKPSPKEDLPACALHKEGYDLYPQIHVDGFPGQAWKGYGGLRDYLNQLRGDIPGRCFAVEAGPGEVVLVPPGWAHCTIRWTVPSRWPLGHGASGNMALHMRVCVPMGDWPISPFGGKISRSL